MANRPDDTHTNPIMRAVQTRAEQMGATSAREEREREEQRRIERLQALQAQIAPRAPAAWKSEAGPVAAAASAAPYDSAAVAARIDLMRARFGQARTDAVSALLFLGDAQQDCDAIAEACAANRWSMMAEGAALLSDTLRRALPDEARHLDLIALLIDALYALRRAETRPDMGRTGADLLRGLKLAINRELAQTQA